MTGPMGPQGPQGPPGPLDIPTADQRYAQLGTSSTPAHNTFFGTATIKDGNITLAPAATGKSFTIQAQPGSAPNPDALVFRTLDENNALTSAMTFYDKNSFVIGDLTQPNNIKLDGGNGTLTTAVANVTQNISVGGNATVAGNVMAKAFLDPNGNPIGGGGTGTVTSIAAGTGLTGGPITTSGTISLDTNFTDGRYLKLTGGTLTGGLNGTFARFSSSTSSIITPITTVVAINEGSGDGLLGISHGGSTGVVGKSASPLSAQEEPGSFGVQGISNNPGGVGVSGHASGAQGTGAQPPVGVRGLADDPAGLGVAGLATSTMGFTAGVAGQAQSPAGSGVIGVNSPRPILPPIFGAGVQGISTFDGGTGVSGVVNVVGAALPSFGVTGVSAGLMGTGVNGTGSLAGVTGLNSNVAPSVIPMDARPGVVGKGNAGVLGLGNFATVAQGDSIAETGVHGKGFIGVRGSGSGLSSTAGRFDIDNTGTLLLGVTNGVNTFSVDSLGDVTTLGSFAAKSGIFVASDGSDSTMGGFLGVAGNLGLGGNFSTFGNATVAGNLTVDGAIIAGTKDFKIDHPLAPTSKYLYHASVESSEMMDIYTGNVVLDGGGEAAVQLPEWFEALNGDFRYQLTAIGGPAPGLYIAQEIQDQSFRIAGGKPGGKVSWQVTGTRQDAFARAHRIRVEEEKPATEQGYYLHPDAFGLPAERGIEWSRAHQSNVSARTSKNDGRETTQEKK